MIVDYVKYVMNMSLFFSLLHMFKDDNWHISLFARFVLFRPIKKRSFNLLCVLDIFPHLKKNNKKPLALAFSQTSLKQDFSNFA